MPTSAVLRSLLLLLPLLGAFPARAQPAAPGGVRARLLAVGDVLVHGDMLAGARTEDGGHDFTGLLAAARPWVESGDLAIANLEVTLTGPPWPYAGYPRFNAPAVLARNLQALGFDALTRANNHVLDYGAEGLRNTAQALDALGMPHTGAFLTQQEQDTVLVMEPKPGLRVALLSYTYGTNGYRLPAPHSVNLLDETRIRTDVARARHGANADLVVVALHFGTEYTAGPDAEQLRWTAVARDAGADVVLGNHPHVVHRAELKEGRAVIYSLGNFTAGQPKMATREGVLLVLDVVKDGRGARVEALGYVPTWMHDEGGTRRLELLEPLAERAAKGEWAGSAADKALLQVALTDLATRVGGEGVVKLPAVPPEPRVGAQPAVSRVYVPRPTGLLLSEGAKGWTLELDGQVVQPDAWDEHWVRAAAGVHHLVARAPGVLEVALPVTVKDGALTPVSLVKVREGPDGRSVPPTAGVGELEVTAEPASAVVRVDGFPVGRAPNRFYVSPGLHVVHLSCPWCEPVERRVVVTRGRPALVQQVLRVRKGTLLARVAQPGTRVAVDGVDRGVASPEVAVEPLTPGLHRVRLMPPGGTPHEESVFVGEGTPTRVVFDAVDPAPGAALPVTVRFSEAHLAYYAVPSHQAYGPGSSGELFAQMRKASEVACHHFRIKTLVDKTPLHAFMRPAVVAKPPWNGFVTSLVAGCFNFFQMNDMRPDLDFHLVQRLYPEARKECFSVGFMQPYWMHTVLGCERLSLVDLDWRIHDGHQQLLSRFREGRLAEGPGFDAALAEVKLGWTARFDGQPPLPETSASAERLCLSAAVPACRGVLQHFQAKAASVKSVELQVSALHDATYAFLPGVLPVMFFSNALESIYTTRPQFDVLVEKVSRGLPRGGKAVMVYHAAGRQQFGVYELEAKGDGAYRLTTRCKDDYLSSPIKGLKVIPYTTWFEEVTESRPPFTPCKGHPLLKGME